MIHSIKLNNAIDMLDLEQSVNSPEYRDGHLLDMVITENDKTFTDLAVFDVCLTDRSMITWYNSNTILQF